MTGRQRTTTSPSSTSSSRSTPWVDGCCGPMLTVSSSRCSSGLTSSVEPTSWVLVPGVPGRTSASARTIDVSRDGEVDGLRPEGFGASQRVALPVIGQHDALQVGVALEANTEQVEQLALVPVDG